MAFTTDTSSQAIALAGLKGQTSTRWEAVFYLGRTNGPNKKKSTVVKQQRMEIFDFGIFWLILCKRNRRKVWKMIGNKLESMKEMQQQYLTWIRLMGWKSGGRPIDMENFLAFIRFQKNIPGGAGFLINCKTSSDGFITLGPRHKGEIYHIIGT